MARMWLQAAAMLLCLPIAGCGGMAVPVSAPAATKTGLNGNWLLTGSLPFLDPFNPGPHGFGLSMTFATNGSTVSGGGIQNTPCGSSSLVGGSTLVTGTIAADGTFTAQTPDLGAPLQVLRLSGMVPPVGASTWNGSYSLTESACSAGSQTLTGTFTAMRIADLTGTYTASTPVPVDPGSLGGPVQMVMPSFTLEQGATLPGAAEVDSALLSGSITLEGATCLKTGTAVAGIGSGVSGTSFNARYTMNDGSTLTVFGDVEDVGSARLVVQALFDTGGTCGGLTSLPFEVVRR